MAGTRKSKHSKHGRMSRERYGRRPFETRAPLPVKIIVCDDSRTAPAYFNELKREVKQYVTLKIVPAKCASSASTIIDRAIAERDTLRVDNHESGDSVWALIDLECEQHLRQTAFAEKKRAEQFEVNVALSDPSFELWTLLHLEDAGEEFPNCDAIIKRIELAWKARFDHTFPRKAQADYSKIIGLRDEAVCRAKRHWENKDPSRTEVYKLIEDIDSHLP